MGSRPPAIEIRSRSHGPLGSDYEPSLRPLPSPRLHVAGDVPPELSPLDAFAAQSRLLAKKLEEGMKGENRMSRLPPLSSESPLIASRPGFFRSASARDAENIMADPQSSRLGMRTEVDEPTLRPISVYPRMSKIPSPGPMLNFPLTHDDDDETNRGRKPGGTGNNIMHSRTEESPGPIGQLPSGRVQDRSPSHLSSRPSIDSISQQRSYDVRALAPPRSPFSPKIPSLRSISADGSDEESAAIAPSERNNLRKLSSSSSLSTSPISPFMPRSPSIYSDVSASTNRLSKPAFNFSRPLSRAEPPPEMLMRQSSMDSERFMSRDDIARMPSNLSPGIPPPGTQETPAPSTIYSTFALPRGKMPEPGSLTSPKLEQPSSSNQSDLPQPSSSKTETSPPRANRDPNAEKSAEWHVTKGIECHENGSLNESTYHLRIAAKQNHPTGMLLYALACRHGWGMRANQQEGVLWLRKAAESATLEVNEDENAAKGGQAVDVVDQKQRKAQFALSMCELGMSHLNGWGIEQDKVLALQCFEIAGAWGDADALAEAGFCYAQGVGCKKDMKKSAKYYRMAESKGISMVGNSWIHKSKYKEDPVDDDTSGLKKGRNKSQTRSIFARKKSS
ncbi:hypothetical protein VE01_08177 [Pseudogymnoascus verrucosus]|uniref:Cell cycle inhibitor Nif1 n=1 Tax=Pseudogymnoascus verrucosus TaxID=342668 RepID=A0A1B8GD72_9PEZI|nr:uncharacterized protein VE01_08177 [Pseudogymnoascus verrucosus]OBT93778.2 hypothetical protein VE01_08177 [Pseudogymnoascus verrucosus]